jgi:hypothetical protein
VGYPTYSDAYPPYGLYADPCSLAGGTPYVGYVDGNPYMGCSFYPYPGAPW